MKMSGYPHLPFDWLHFIWRGKSASIRTSVWVQWSETPFLCQESKDDSTYCLNCWVTRYTDWCQLWWAKKWDVGRASEQMVVKWGDGERNENIERVTRYTDWCQLWWAKKWDVGRTSEQMVVKWGDGEGNENIERVTRYTDWCQLWWAKKWDVGRTSEQMVVKWGDGGRNENIETMKLAALCSRRWESRSNRKLTNYYSGDQRWAG